MTHSVNRNIKERQIIESDKLKKDINQESRIGDLHTVRKEIRKKGKLLNGPH